MNKPAQFTPGPWTIQLHNDLDTGDIRGANNEEIAMCYMPDATLIAAAPAMYEALREAQELIRSLVAEEMIHSSELQRVGNCQANMWEALAQAEGKQ